jgi:hypothetical protein
MRRSGAWRLALAMTLVVGLVIARQLAFGQSTGSPDGTDSCIASVPHLMDGVAALSHFAENVDQALPTIGRGSAPGASPPAYVSDYRAGRIAGYLANIAVSGPDRSQLDADARSLGYQVGKWPLVPLVGPVVQHNPGLLETYVTVLAFRSAAGSRSWMSFESASFGLANYTVLASPDSRVAIAVEGILGVNDGLHEHILIYEVPIANTVLELAYQGGFGLSEASVASQTETAIERFAKACGPI